MKNWFRQTRRRQRSVSGFTLLELLVIIIIIGVLFAIAAPSWNAVMNRQRVNVVRDQVTQIIRQAQSDARRTKRPRIVVFDNSTGVPRSATLAQSLNADEETTDIPIPISNIQNWQTLGNGDIQPGVLEFLSPVPPAAGGQLVFRSDGSLDPVSVEKATLPNVLFSVTVRQKNTSAKTNRCVVVTTLLGATRLAEGDNCPTT